MSVNRDVEAAGPVTEARPAGHDAAQDLPVDFGFGAVTDIERHVVHLHGERHGDDRAPVPRQLPGQIAVEEIGVPEEAGPDQQIGRERARRAARAEPAARSLPAGALQDLDAAIEIARFVLRRLGRRNDVLAPRVGRDLVARADDGLDQVRIGFGQDAADVEHRGGLGGRQHVEDAIGADLGSVVGPGTRLQIENAGLERIAHRPDARCRLRRPPFEHHADRHSERLVRRPTGRQRRTSHIHPGIRPQANGRHGRRLRTKMFEHFVCFGQTIEHLGTVRILFERCGSSIVRSRNIRICWA